MSCNLQALCLLKIKDKNIQSTLCGHLWIFLPQRTCRCISRIFKGFFLPQLLLGNHLFKAGNRHIDLSAHLQKRNRAGQPQRYRANCADIFGHILPDKSISAGRAPNQHAVAVFQRNRKSVNLRLYHIHRVCNHFPNAGIEVQHLLLRKDVLQGTHLNGMLDLCKAVGRSAAHAMGRRIRGEQLGESFLQID